MNLFFLSEDPEEAARFHCNKHVVKMIVETAQLLSSVHWKNGTSAPYKDSRSVKATLGPYVWVAESLGNYRWAVKLGLHLCLVYRQRYGEHKTHKSQPVLEWLRDNEPTIPDNGLTPMRPAVPEDLQHITDPIEAYKTYYIRDKRQFAVWPEGQQPQWFQDGVAALQKQERAKRLSSQAASGESSTANTPTKRHRANNNNNNNNNNQQTGNAIRTAIPPAVQTTTVATGVSVSESFADTAYRMVTRHQAKLLRLVRHR